MGYGIQKEGRKGGRVLRNSLGIALQFGLYTILPSPTLYGVWHKKEGSVGERILRNGRAIVMH